MKKPMVILIGFLFAYLLAACGAGAGGIPIRPVSFAIDDRNNVYMLDSVGRRVCIYDANGKLLDRWGKFGIAIGEFNFIENDAGLVFDSQGNLYVEKGRTIENGNNRIQKFRQK